MPSVDPARERARMPAETGRILETRSLTASHRRLAEVLTSELRVLDVGCGTGVITADIAEAVGPHGLAVGCDISEALLIQGLKRRTVHSALRFVRADLYDMPFRRAFDVVTAARVVQWLARPVEAIRALSSAVILRGKLLVLDYDHERLQWVPPPPSSMRHFYATFLRWRAQAGMDNSIAGHLPHLFDTAGLVDIHVTPQHEHTKRGDVDFVTRIGIWAEVAATRGHQMVADGALTEAERATAEAQYRLWVESDAESMTLHLEATEGVVCNAR
jgi:SAM-dependent methyltransferase